ncbi:uncharacterized protein AB675_7144 [Cyphellophora attinorum]|uniref:Acyltransferase 3 domain-containing protein n=1 Tax=Cyphellophora attinorum TaxID=1664694 RepID=A0A0N1HVA7_9EURO|nr:uncharacterized protein AB675_7144 [Phialophora attinorum]KPI43643.1 hypothetical protein AB675_7144 [Phialophora attinorum]
MADDTASTNSGSSDRNSNHSSRRAMLGLRQLSDDTKHFFRDNYKKARDLRRNRHSNESPNSPSVDTESPTSLADSVPTSPSPLPYTPTKSSSSTFSFSRDSRSAHHASPAVTASRSNKSLPRTPVVPRQQTPSLSSAKPRLHHISTLRIGLTSLVVYHHTALPYGGLGRWGWQSTFTPGISPTLTCLTGFNQTFFMGGFFWIAGYLTYGQLRRIATTESSRDRRPKQKQSLPDFALSRMKRLVLPTIGYTLILRPLASLMIAVDQNNWQLLSQQQIIQILKSYFMNLRGVTGPVWFPALLFIFDTLAAGLASVHPETFTSNQSSLKPGSWQANAFKWGACLSPLWHRTQSAFSIPQAQFGSRSISYLHTSRTQQKPLRKLALAFSVMTLGLGAVAASVALQRQGSLSKLSIPQAVKLLEGHGTLQSAMYALWNELGFVTVFPALLAVCQRYCNTKAWTTIRLPRWVWPFSQTSEQRPGNGKGREEQQKSGEWIEIDLSRYAYATFLVHAIVSLGVELAMERFILPKLFALPAPVKIAKASKAAPSGETVGAGGWLSQALPSTKASTKTANTGSKSAAKPSGWSTGNGASVSWWLPPLLTVTVGTVNVVASWAVGIGLLEGIPVMQRWI